MSSMVGHPVVLLVVCLIGATVTRADELRDLRGLLGQFPGSIPVTASITVEREQWGDEDKGPLGARLELRAQHGAESLRVEYPGTLLREVAEEERTVADPDRRGLRAALDAITATEVEGILNYAPLLASWIRDGHVEEVSEGRILVRNDPAEKGFMVKEFKRTFEISLGPDGVPVSVVVESRKKGGIPLLRVTNLETRTDTLRAVGDRLVASESTRALSVKGLGMSFGGTVKSWVQLDPPPGVEAVADQGRPR